MATESRGWDLDAWTYEYRPQIDAWTIMVNGQDAGAAYAKSGGGYIAHLAGAEPVIEEVEGFDTLEEAVEWVRRNWAAIWAMCADCGEEISREQAQRSVGKGEDLGARCPSCLRAAGLLTIRGLPVERR